MELLFSCISNENKNLLGFNQDLILIEFGDNFSYLENIHFDEYFVPKPEKICIDEDLIIYIIGGNCLTIEYFTTLPLKEVKKFINDKFNFSWYYHDVDMSIGKYNIPSYNIPSSSFNSMQLRILFKISIKTGLTNSFWNKRKDDELITHLALKWKEYSKSNSDSGIKKAIKFVNKWNS